MQRGIITLCAPRAVVVRPNEPRPLITTLFRLDFYETGRYTIRYTSNARDKIINLNEIRPSYNLLSR